jgi:hypothetical protein
MKEEQVRIDSEGVRYGMYQNSVHLSSEQVEDIQEYLRDLFKFGYV